MSEAIAVAIITGTLALAGGFGANYVQNNKTKALIIYRLDAIERKQDKHNSIIERTYKLEQNFAVLANRTNVSEHRLDDLERKE